MIELARSGSFPETAEISASGSNLLIEQDFGMMRDAI